MESFKYLIFLKRWHEHFACNLARAKDFSLTNRRASSKSDAIEKYTLVVFAKTERNAFICRLNKDETESIFPTR